MLDTNLKYVESQEETEELLKNNVNVMICCGKMGLMCIPVYDIMKCLESKYSYVQMRDVDFDIPAASFIRSLPECALFMGLPFTVYFKDGKVVEATSSIQNERQITDILDDAFKEANVA